MAEQGIIDSDGHVREPLDLWDRYMPANLRERGPHVVEGSLYMSIDGVTIPPKRSYENRKKRPFSTDFQEAYRNAVEKDYSAQSQLEAMDVEGISVAVLFPSIGLTLMGVDGVDAKMTTAIARAYNSWLADFCSEGDGRLFGAAMLDVRDVDGAIAELRRGVDDLGMVAAFLRPNPVGGHPWHDPIYEPLWSCFEELDVPVCFHEGGSVLLPQVGSDRFDLHAYWHICTHPMEQQMAMVALLLGGVAERHPALRMAFLECGAGWLPYWMWRMDEHVEGEAAEFEHLSMSPSEYVERQCFVSIDTDEHTGVAVIEALGQPRVVWGSDYPHPDGKYPRALKILADLPEMKAERFRVVTSEAPRALYRHLNERGAPSAL